MNDDAHRAASRIVHEDLPVDLSPSGLPSLRHIVTDAIGAQAIYVGQQKLEPGDQVLLHTHPVEEALVFTAGTGVAQLGDEKVAIGPGVTLFIPPGIPHGFQNTSHERMTLFIVFEGPRFAETAICGDFAPL